MGNTPSSRHQRLQVWKLSASRSLRGGPLHSARGRAAAPRGNRTLRCAVHTLHRCTGRPPHHPRACWDRDSSWGAIPGYSQDWVWSREELELASKDFGPKTRSGSSCPVMGGLCGHQRRPQGLHSARELYLEVKGWGGGQQACVGAGTFSCSSSQPQTTGLSTTHMLRTRAKPPSSSGPGRDHLRGTGLWSHLPGGMQPNAASSGRRGLEEDGCWGDEHVGAQPKGLGSPLSLIHTAKSGLASTCVKGSE